MTQWPGHWSGSRATGTFLLGFVSLRPASVATNLTIAPRAGPGRGGGGMTGPGHVKPEQRSQITITASG